MTSYFTGQVKDPLLNIMIWVFNLAGKITTIVTEKKPTGKTRIKIFLVCIEMKCHK